METNSCKQKVAVIYHSGDPDGFMSGYLLKKLYPDATLFGYNYQETAAWMDDTTFDMYIFGDVTPPINWLKSVPNKNQIVVIFDHHADAYQSIITKHLDYECRLIFGFNDSLSGCQIIWNKYDSHLKFSETNLSRLVMLIGKYDTWQHVLLPSQQQNEVLSVNEFLRTLSFEDFCDKVDTLTTTIFTSWIEIGNTLTDKIRTDNKKIAKTGRYLDKSTFIFNGYPNYWSFMDIAKQTGTEPKMLIGFRFDLPNNIVEFAIRTKDATVCARDIAKQFNGNGHPDSAGFRTKLSLGLCLIEHPEDILIRRF